MNFNREIRQVCELNLFSQLDTMEEKGSPDGELEAIECRVGRASAID